MNKAIRIANILKKFNNDIVKEHDDKIFKSWYLHYQNELVNMYNTCVDPILNILFDDFIELVFICTNNKIDKNTYKYYKPLI